MKKKKLTVAQKKVLELEQRLANGTEAYTELRDKYNETTKKLNEANTVIDTAKRILSVVANHNEYAPDDLYLRNHRRGEMLNDSDNLLSLAIAATGKLSEYKGKEIKTHEMELNARLSTINLGEERKQLIHLAVEQNEKYIVQTDPRTGMLNVFIRDNQGGRGML